MNCDKSNKSTLNNKRNKRNKQSLEKKLLSYSIAAGAAITCIENAQAVQYRDLGNQMVSDGSLDLDFNNDGMNDFKVIHSGGSFSQYKIQFSGASNFAPVENGFVGKDFNISKLEEGHVIDKNPPNTFIKRGVFGSLYSSNDAVTEYGNFLGEEKAFFGIRFKDQNGDTLNAWARVSMPDDGSKITFHDVAYNEIPGGSIEAGEGLPGTAVPEPGTLGMLAMGAAGVCAWRKRKDKKN